MRAVRKPTLDENELRACDRPGSRSAFTLMETVAAIVILAVAVPAMMWSLSEAQRYRIDPIMTSRATWLATEKLEEIIADRYSASRGWQYITEGNYPDETEINLFPGFQRRVNVIQTGPDLQTAGDGYKRITVTVEWAGRHAESVNQLDLSMVLTEY